MQMRYQVSHPQYCYRWAGLLVGLVAFPVGLLVVYSLVVGVSLSPELVAKVPWLASDRQRPHPPVVPVSAEPVRQAAGTDRVVALTFDDGPHPEHTPQVLALLARYRAVATFCMIGSEAEQHPDLVRAVVAAGMHLCDHTVSHDLRLIDRPEPRIEAEIVDGRADLLAAAGVDVPIDYFRAPGGRWSDPMRQIAADHGMRPLSWSVDPRDWSRPGTAQIVRTVQQQVRPGAVILLHDGGERRDQTIAALAELLPWLVEQGYRFDVPGR